MKKNDWAARLLLYTECSTVFIFVLLPPILSQRPFILPAEPAGLYAQAVFCLQVLTAAAYEEILYRMYVPYRLHTVYHLFLRNSRTYCFNTAAAERRLYRLFTEFPAVVLFALAHRYLGILSILFAAAAGAFFRVIYIRLSHIVYPVLSLLFTVCVHGLWNIAVYYYLWKHIG